MESCTASTKCQCLPPEFTPPGRGCKQPETCLGPGGAGIGDYCEVCSDNKCRRHAMEAVQKTRDLLLKYKTSRRKCKCAHDNIIGCESPASCAGFGSGAQGFCEACENLSCTTHYINTSRHFKQISRATGRYIATERAVPRPPTSSRSIPPSAPALDGQHATKAEQPHSNPSAYSQKPAPSTTNKAKQPTNLHGDPSTLSQQPTPPVLDHAQQAQAAQPYKNGGPSTTSSYPHLCPAPPTTTDHQPLTPLPLQQQPDTLLPPTAAVAAAAENKPQATATATATATAVTARATSNSNSDGYAIPTVPFPASGDYNTDGVFGERRCVCQGTWTCKAGGLCEETVMFLEGDLCGICEIFDCKRWEA